MVWGGIPMNTTLFLIAVVLIIAATYANMEREHKLGVVLSGTAGGFAVWLLFYGKLNPILAFAIGFTLTAIFEAMRFLPGKR